jgi:hypothetical protein
MAMTVCQLQLNALQICVEGMPAMCAAAIAVAFASGTCMPV